MGDNYEETELSGEIIEHEIPKPFYKVTQFWIGAFCMVVVGATNPLVSKSAYLYYSKPCPPEDACDEEQFSGFLMLALFKYIYHFILAAALYFGFEYKLRYKRGKKPYFSTVYDIEHSRSFPPKAYLRFILTSTLDCSFTVFSRSATVLTRASTVSVIGSLQIATAVVADMFISRRAVTIGRTIGLVFILIGMIVYATGSLKIESDGQVTNPTLGALLAVIAAVSRGLHSSLQGRNMKKYKLPPIKMVFVESCFCLVWMAVVITVFHLTGFQDFVKEFWMFVNSWQLITTVNVFALECFVFNGGASIVGKFVSGLFRMIMARMTAFLMWCFEMCLGWTKFTFITFLGWSILFFGVAVYGGLHPKLRSKARWFFRPLLCGDRLDPPEGSILSAKQEARRQRNDLTPASKDTQSVSSSLAGPETV